MQRACEQHRQDDTPEVIKKRFDTFRNECMAVIQELQNQGRCISINASKSEDEVFADVQASLRDSLPMLFGLN